MIVNDNPKALRIFFSTGASEYNIVMIPTNRITIENEAIRAMLKN